MELKYVIALFIAILWSESAKGQGGRFQVEFSPHELNLLPVFISKQNVDFFHETSWQSWSPKLSLDYGLEFTNWRISIGTNLFLSKENIFLNYREVNYFNGNLDRDLDGIYSLSQTIGGIFLGGSRKYKRLDFGVKIGGAYSFQRTISIDNPLEQSYIAYEPYPEEGGVRRYVLKKSFNDGNSFSLLVEANSMLELNDTWSIGCNVTYRRFYYSNAEPLMKLEVFMDKEFLEAPIQSIPKVYDLEFAKDRVQLGILIRYKVF